MRSLQQRSILVVALVAISFLKGGCPRSGHVAERLVTVRLKWSHEIQFAGFYVAKAKGYYADYGLNVQLLPGIITSGKENVEMPAIQLVATGQDDFGISGPESILLARDKGVRIRAVAAIFQESPFCYIALKSEGIENLRQLRGQPVGVHFDSQDILTYRAMLKGAKPPIPESEIKEMPVPIGDLTPLTGTYDPTQRAWRSRKVKAIPAYRINEPIELALKYHLESTIIRPAAYDVDLYGDTLFVTEEFERENRDVVDRFVAASIYGWLEALRDPELAVTETLKQDPALDKDIESKKMDALLSLVRQSPKPVQFGAMSYEKWKAVQRLTEERLGGSHPDITKVFTNDHLPGHSPTLSSFRRH